MKKAKLTCKEFLYIANKILIKSLKRKNKKKENENSEYLRKNNNHY